jgi:4-hydroxythreonine-4-phosphate dehydrogenase
MGDALRRLREEAPDVEVVALGAREGLPRDFSAPLREIPLPRSGGPDARAGSVSLEALRKGVALCLRGEADALVTGPVHKPSLHAAGERVPGQTELLQALTGVPLTGMLMAAEESRLGPPLRILLATTHLPLREVSDALSPGLLESRVRLLHGALRAGWGLPRPRIALCGLNPHASDGGLFGDEEARVLSPVAERLRREGLEVEGPYPADTVFLHHLDGRADAVVVPYHDVGMAVFKTLAFHQGVNVTLGLPFVRTSPDHGTAFDLAGTGKASSASSLSALRLAVRLARRSPEAPAPEL